MHQAVLSGTQIPLTGIITPILTTASLQYFFGCFLFAFLEGYSLVLFFKEMLATFLCLAPITWEFSASLTKTSFWSFFKYSSLFLLFFSSTCFLFLASFCALILVTFLTFYTSHLRQ